MLKNADSAPIYSNHRSDKWHQHTHTVLIQIQQSYKETKLLMN